MIPVTSRGFVLGILVLGILGAGVLSVDDARRDERPSYDSVGDGIVAEPHDGPNGAYAYLDGDGHLVIDLTADSDALESDGVSAESVTAVGDIFTLANTGEERTRVWLDHDADTVTFWVEREATPIEGKDDAVVLEPGESVRVGFTVDASRLESSDTVIESLRFRTKTIEKGDENDRDADSDTPHSSPSIEAVETDTKTRETGASTVCTSEQIDENI